MDVFNPMKALGSGEAAGGVLIDAVFGLEAVDVRGFLELLD